MSPAAGCKTTRHSTRRGVSWRDCYTAGVTVSLLLLCATPALQQRYLTEDSTPSSSPPPDALALGIDTRTWKLRIRPRLFQIGQQRMSAGLRNLLILIAIPVIKLTVTVVLVFYIATSMYLTTLASSTSYSVRQHTTNPIHSKQLKTAVARLLTLKKCLLLIIIPVVVSMLLLLAGDVERNPGPVTGVVTTKSIPGYRCKFPDMIERDCGYTALHSACRDGLHDVVRIMITKRGANPRVTTSLSNMPIHVAAIHGQFTTIRVLVRDCGFRVDEPGWNGYTALHMACGLGHVNTVKTLVSELGADPKATTVHGAMPTHLAAAYGYQDIVSSLVNDFGCNIDEQGQYQWTPLHYACWKGHAAMVHMLIAEFGADPKATTVHGDMPIHVAAEHGQQDIVSSLVNDFGCNIDKQGQNQWTPLHYG